jgi:hypothetical protein
VFFASLRWGELPRYAWDHWGNGSAQGLKRSCPIATVQVDTQ